MHAEHDCHLPSSLKYQVGNESSLPAEFLLLQLQFVTCSSQINFKVQIQAVVRKFQKETYKTPKELKYSVKHP